MKRKRKPSPPRRKPSPKRGALFVLGFFLLPLAFVLRDLSFRYPQWTERFYGQWAYPAIVSFLGAVNSLVPFSLAEAALAAILLLGLLWLLFGKRPPDRVRKRGFFRFLLRSAAVLWISAGAVGLLFLLLWGLNYARPSLESRLDLSADDARAEEVLRAGRRCAEAASRLHDTLNGGSDGPTRLPMDLRALNDLIDDSLRDLALPGFPIHGPTSPVKELVVSPAVSYLGLTGVFVPFTGEPSVNHLLPDVSMPVVVAHEKAHQRGITNEGEANLVAFLACARMENVPYLPYAAYLSAAQRLIGAASRYLPQEAGSAWELLGPGPRRDVTAVRDFWRSYEGLGTKLADKVNDSYLRSFRVPDGVESYGHVTRLLVALDRQGRLVEPN
jgi:hypothetical protein